MNIPELPAELTLLPVDRALVLSTLLAAFLGVASIEVTTTLRPFARQRRSPERALLGLSALAVGCLILGASIDREATALIAAAVAAALGWLGYWRVSRRLGRDTGATDVLSDAELRRDKTSSDRWVLVTGPHQSGKTTLVEGMLAAARTRFAGPVRSAEDGTLRATEVSLQDPAGGAAVLRIWEAPAIQGGSRRLPSLDDFNAVVLTIDPTQHTPIANSFPDVLRNGRGPVDANTSVLELAASLRGDCFVWAVGTKADLLRFSVHPKLLTFGLQLGPGWRQQVSSMNVRARRELAEAIELEQLSRDHQPAFDWGGGSPLFAHVGGANGSRSFGDAELMRAILDTLWPEWGR